ncbi:hypothetical protein TREMEDRAFT_71520 [Tremella mesenterica DSM 1558]|uniref:uncharacterized protein n=1 Tax=Tremella mesenterica (strain ATCC 24925 / CBS 8224 / DSM 1558 / NBRC 9311 / NRRL Y-6157 / RJB 2259-6 / UBC 559-6) TaxID=578456 RepID=UPI0003F48BF3|nr:uncharacterized protein TREMEDRAFT_71520 [Tremella mesenterica DSM 1558]EIW70089.1 hypothetical protein TREMEDRAFT_71520 [Tremella mesenterica DSM 1558]
MSTVKAVDHALVNGASSPASASAASPGGMTNDEKVAVGGMIARDERKGANVHAFDPDASPAQKAAAAGQAKAQLGIPSPSSIKNHGVGSRAVAIDTSNKANVPRPTVTLDDVDKTSRAEGEEVGAAAMPGAVPAGAAPSVPTWVLAGWQRVANADLGSGDAKTQEQLGVLADYLSEQTYGAWYHNAAVILFAVLATRFMTAIHLGWGWIILIFAFCSSYYTLSIARTRHRARDDIQRELVKTRLVTETESADWMNSFLERFWLIYEPVLSQTIVASVDAVLEANTPSFLESIRMTTFTLGTKAPRIDYVRTFPKTPEDVVIMDWALSFTPNDLMDITPRQAQNRVNPKVVLSIRVGKGPVSKSLPILLEDMSFTGRMRIKLKLMTNFPHIQTVDLSFIEKPTFDYVLKPIGGDFGFDINNIPGLAPFIRDQVHANLGPMMYDPNVFTIDLQALLSGTPLDSAIGVLRVHIINARGLKAVKLGGGAPDPYVSIALGSKPAIAKTKTISSSSNPTFSETHFVLLNNLAEVLALQLYDYNEHRPDNLLGTATQELQTLQEDNEQEGLVGKIIGGGKDRGELRYDIAWYPVLKPAKNPDGTFEALPDTQTGIVRLTLHQAKDLDISRKHGNLNTYARVFLGGSKEEAYRTKTMKHSNQPIWESAFEFLVPEKNNSVITLQVVDVQEFATDPTLGVMTIRLTDLLEAHERQQDWFPLRNSRAGKIRLTAEWKPVSMPGSMNASSAYVPPIGILRIWLKRAVDVKNVEAALGGKSDPYVRVMGNNKVLARTEVVNNNLNPEWDQIVYVPVHSLREHIFLELMDYQNIGKDRSLGSVEVRVDEFAQANNDQKFPYISKGPQGRNDRIKLDKANAYKGQLVYEVDFKPAVSLRGGVSFDPEKNPIETAIEEEQTNPDGSVIESAVASPITPASTSLANGPGVNVLTTATAQTSESKGGGEQTASEDPEKGVEMSVEEIMSCQSGVLVFQVISGQLARRGSLEVMFDDGYWPAYTSARARSTHPTWDQVGEGFVRELDFSRIWLRINAADDSDKDDIVAEFKCDTKDFLEQCIQRPADFLLSQADGSNRSLIRMSARYVPVDIKLEPRESINNMGVLRVDVLHAKNLMAADRSGKSDPYVVFTLNGQRVFKSETKKKNLSPVWDESFEVMVPSRVSAKFAFEINDWDRVGTSTSLGGGAIDLANLEPFESTEVTLPVVHEKGDRGTFSIRLLFQPEIIARSRQKTSTFSTAGRAITTVGGAGVGVGKGVFHGGEAVAMGLGKGVGAIGGIAGRRVGLVKRKDRAGKEVLVPAESDDISISDGFDVTSSPARGTSADGLAPPLHEPASPSIGGSFVGGSGGSGGETGTLMVTVLGVKDLKGGEKGSPKPYVQLKMGGKSHKTDHVKGSEADWNETFSFHVTPGSGTFNVTVFDHHSFGRDPELGEAEVDIWRHLKPPSLQSTDISIELENGSGLLRLRLEWTPGSNNPSKLTVRGRAGSITSMRDSPGRFSVKSLKKDKSKVDES